MDEITMTNFERVKNMTKEELSEEIRLIANWDRKQKRIAEQDFYIKLLYVELGVPLENLDISVIQYNWLIIPGINTSNKFYKYSAEELVT